MEAATTQRAARRVMTVAAGAVVTVASLAATAWNWRKDAPPATATPSAVAAPVVAPPQVVIPPPVAPVAVWPGERIAPGEFEPEAEFCPPPFELPAASASEAERPSDRVANEPAEATPAEGPALFFDEGAESPTVEPDSEAFLAEVTPETPDAGAPAVSAAEPASADAPANEPVAVAEELPPPPRRPIDVAAYTPAVAGLDDRLRADVQAGFRLGRAGALYAARAKFIGVMRRIALAKDAAGGVTRHADALAEGLRALNEADDFVPRGDALEAELDTRAIAASHVTPIVRDRGEGPPPHECVARYSDYAAAKLGEAIAGAQAGSMACYGLGKTYARLETLANDPAAGRKSGVMHRAALVAHPANYMAANELGVRLASLGRYEQARGVLRHAVAYNAPISKIHENLAAVEKRLGHADDASFSEQQAVVIAQQEKAAGELSRRRGVQWVAPRLFQAPGAAPSQPVAMQPSPPSARPSPAPQPAETKGGWKDSFDRIKRATGWSKDPAPVALQTPVPASRAESVLR